MCSDSKLMDSSIFGNFYLCTVYENLRKRANIMAFLGKNSVEAITLAFLMVA